MNTTTAKMVVPYITSWDSELKSIASPTHRLEVRDVPTRGGLVREVYYSDEIPHDRDPAGVLWGRQISRRGQGKPMFSKVHAGRQRRAVMKALCQVCGAPSDTNPEGTLWVLVGNEARPWNEHGYTLTGHPPTCAACLPVAQAPRPAGTRWGVVGNEARHWNEHGYTLTGNPPICAACVPVAQGLCPAVRRHHAVVRARRAEAWGVAGALVGTDDRPELPYGHPVLRM